MPYIDPKRRELVVTQPAPRQGVNEPLNVGELTYQLTVVLEQYRRLHGDRFQTFAEISAACTHAGDEFRRRVVHPYEDQKCSDQGDCYAPAVPALPPLADYGVPRDGCDCIACVTVRKESAR